MPSRLISTSIWQPRLRCYLYEMRSALIITTAVVLSFLSGEGSAEPKKPSSWSRATEPRQWSFPRDHGAHPDYRTEWWYFTGNLETAEGRPFGFEFCIFRHGVVFDPKQAGSRWAMRDLWFGHAHISDVKGTRFRFIERYDRAPGLVLAAQDASGAKPIIEGGMNIAMHTWRIQQTGENAFRIMAPDSPVALDLELTAAKPMIFQGDRGLSQKADGAGNASHYYSYTRLKAKGRIAIEGDKFDVTGQAWYDKEFSTDSGGQGQAGWDWFSIQLDNNEEFMLYNMRGDDGTIDRNSDGTFVSADGTSRQLKLGDYSIEALGSWTSPHTRAVYPSSWRVKVPSLDLDITVTPRLKDQEMALRGMSEIAYWEGSCAIQGTRAGQPITGLGYTELSGYYKPLSKASEADGGVSARETRF